MNTSIIKRDGRIVNFESDKIYQAIKKAFLSHSIKNSSAINSITNSVIHKLYEYPKIDIPLIQKEIENSLIEYGFVDIARSYIEYRKTRDLCRENNSLLVKDIKGLIEQNNFDLLNENANKDSAVIPTQRDLLAGIISKHYAKNFLLDKDIVKAHEEGDIHYHDLDYSPFFPMFNCMLIDLNNMLSNGFKMGNAEIESPKSISTATAITAQIIAQVASHIYGGTTINRIDEILSPYVSLSYDKHKQKAIKWKISDVEGYAQEQTEKECFDAFQALEYEINTLHTANGQTPFVTFGFGLGISKDAVLIQKAILQNRIQGLGKNKKTAIFPKLVFAIKDGINFKPSDPNYSVKLLAVNCATKRMYPDILNYESLVKATGSFKTPMGCRSFLNVYYNANSQQEHDGRNNLGVVSINLPRIAIESEGDIDVFWNKLNSVLSLSKKALLSRIERFNGVKAKVAPILYTEGACGIRLSPNDNIIDIFKNGRASVSLGYIGIHEMTEAMFKNSEHLFYNKNKQNFALLVMKKMRNTVDEWKKETGYAFSLYSTPSENLCNRFCELDIKKYGTIHEVNDKGYYTNSFHLDVREKVNPYEKINFEREYPEICNGGFICYGEYPNLQNNPKALEDIWDYTYDKVPYYGTNTPIDECYDCGFSGEFTCTSRGFTCPICNNNKEDRMSVIRRVCGYLGSPNNRPFNKGKQLEVMKRVKHL